MDAPNKEAAQAEASTLPAIEKGQEYDLSRNDLVDLDHARFALLDAISKIKIGNPTDDKLILDNLREAGFWICRLNATPPTTPAVESGEDALDSYAKFDGVGPHAETIRTRASIGESYLECYYSALDDPLLKGWTPADCPSELVSHLLELANRPAVDSESADHGADVQPEADAPSPEVMRLELINIIVAHGGGKITFSKAGTMVDLIISKQMVYYASMADPEVTTDEHARVLAVTEAKGMIEALIRQGGVVCDYMADKGLWQRTAARAREVCAKLEALIT